MSSQLSSSQVRVKTGQIPEKIFVKLYEDQSNLHRAFPTEKKIFIEHAKPCIHP
jgi:hypothetical protein